MNKIKFYLFFISFSLINGIFTLSAQSSYNIDYFGIVSNQLDANMAKMTSDLYFTQLSEISNFNLTDKRIENYLESEPETSSFPQDTISFYSLITKNERTSKWTCTFTVFDSSKNQKFTESKEYDSFYKILMEPKSSLQETIKSIIERDASKIVENPSADKKSTQNTAVSTEFLSGTWDGEEFIDKIVIMRGGRGFVIFNNGASMNITVALKNTSGTTQVSIKQNGRSNASYFPEIPRNIALKAAVDATPIEWNFDIIDDNTLIGKKSTLIASNDQAIPATINVTWNRKF